MSAVNWEVLFNCAASLKASGPKYGRMLTFFFFFYKISRYSKPFIGNSIPRHAAMDHLLSCYTLLLFQNPTSR